METKLNVQERYFAAEAHKVTILFNGKTTTSNKIDSFKDLVKFIFSVAKLEYNERV